jgi:hypothetical protein
MIYAVVALIAFLAGGVSFVGLLFLSAKNDPLLEKRWKWIEAEL